MIKRLKQLRCWVLVRLTHNVALPFLRLVRKPNKFPYDINQLSNFPEGSLGKDLHNFLQTKGLDLLPHYTRHDLKHIVLNYDTTEEGEACLQCFMLGNGRISFPVLATVVFSLITMPEYWKPMIRAYRHGRIAISIHDWEWNNILGENTNKLRLKTGNPEIANN